MGKTLDINRITKIYTIQDPDTFEVRYIGKTVDNLEKRLTGHLYDCKRSKNHRCNWLKSLTKRPIIREIDSCKWKDSANLEIYYIKKYKEEGYRLVNESDGGEGGLGVIKTIETIQKLKSSLRKHSKIVYQYSLDGEYINSYNSPIEAQEELGYRASNISMCCHLSKKSHAGFIWSYKKPNEFNIEDYKHKKFVFNMYDYHISRVKHKKILITNLITGKTSITLSMKQAAQLTGKHLTSICEECKGKRKVRGHYKFEYFNGEEKNKWLS